MSTWKKVRLIALIVVGVLATIVVFQNLQPVEVQVLFTTVSGMPLIFLMLMMLAVGFGLGFGASTYWRWRKNRKVEPSPPPPPEPAPDGEHKSD